MGTRRVDGRARSHRQIFSQGACDMDVLSVVVVPVEIPVRAEGSLTYLVQLSLLVHA